MLSEIENIIVQTTAIGLNDSKPGKLYFIINVAIRPEKKLKWHNINYSRFEGLDQGIMVDTGNIGLFSMN